jgi:golgi to ER traffic protein 4
MGSVKVLENRLKRGLAEGDYYVAEQSCSTLYHRLTQARNRASSPDDFERALGIILSGATELLSRKQVQAGTSLGLLAIKHHSDHSLPANPSNVARVAALCDAYVFDEEAHPGIILEGRKEQLRLVKAAIKWTQSPACSGCQHGDPGLNARAGRLACGTGDFPAAQHYFVRSDAPKDFATALDDWVRSNSIPSERDILLARSVLSYLVEDNIGDASLLRMEFARLSGWPPNVRPGDIKAVPPLGNFSELLIQACQIGERAQALFHRIRTVYEPALKVDPELLKMVSEVGTRYFGIRAPSTGGMAGMMQSMLRGMIGQS